MALWKVYSIQSGKTVKAGLRSEEEAKEWLLLHREGQEDNYLAEEMDFDEQDEWQNRKSGDEEEEESTGAAEDDDDIEKGRYTYSTDDDDGEDDESDLMSEVFDDDDEGGSDEGSVF